MAKEILSPSSPKATAVKEKTTSNNAESSTNVDQLYLLSALVQKDEVMELLKKIVSSKGEIVKDENLGKKTLAYSINKHSELTLLSIFFNAAPAKVTKIEKELYVEETIERYLITTWSAELPKEGEHTFQRNPKKDRY